jgi:hypothetical protein
MQNGWFRGNVEVWSRTPPAPDPGIAALTPGIRAATAARSAKVGRESASSRMSRYLMASIDIGEA